MLKRIIIIFAIFIIYCWLRRPLFGVQVSLQCTMFHLKFNLISDIAFHIGWIKSIRPMANSKQRTKQIVVMAVMLIVYLIGISVIYDIHLAAKVDNNIKFGQSSLGTIQQIQSQTCTHMKPYYIKSGSSYLFSHSYLIIECGKEQYVLDSLPTYFRLTLLDGSIKDTHISKHIEWHNVKNSILITRKEEAIT
eukprot:210717_1